MPKSEKAPKAPKEPKAKGEKKEKAKKDPNAPKKPTSAYMIFCSAKREEVKRNNPEASFGEIGKLLGEAWKACPPGEKAKFEDQAKADKGRYEKEMLAYKA